MNSLCRHPNMWILAARSLSTGALRTPPRPTSLPLTVWFFVKYVCFSYLFVRWVVRQGYRHARGEDGGNDRRGHVVFICFEAN